MKFTRSLIAFSIPAALGALPTNPTIYSPDIRLQENHAQMQISTSSMQGAIEWESFSIASNESVHFSLPRSDASILNLVSGDLPSHLDGSLTSNGNIYLMNPNGILVGKEGSIHSAGFTAAAGLMPIDYFLKNEAFIIDPTSNVSSSGTIETSDHIALIGKSVENSGKLSSINGAVYLLSGERVLVAPNDAPLLIHSNLQIESDNPYHFAIKNSDTLHSFSTEEVDGEVMLLNSGEIKAHTVKLDSAAITLSADSTITAPGGDVKIGSNTSTRFLNTHEGSEIDVSGIGDRSAGSAVLWSTLSTSHLGSIFAEGGPLGGDGGFVEVSSLGSLDLSGSVSTDSPFGKVGTFLIDPCDISIGYWKSSPILSGGSYAPTGSSAKLSIQDLTKYLKKSSVVITTTKGEGGQGNITLTGYLQGQFKGDLTLEADNAIYHNGYITAIGNSNITYNAPEVYIGNPNATQFVKVSTTAGKLTINAPKKLEIVGGKGQSSFVSITGGDGIDISAGDIKLLGGTGTTSMISINAVKDFTIKTTGNFLAMGGTQNNSHISLGSSGKVDLDIGGDISLKSTVADLKFGAYGGEFTAKCGGDFFVETGPTNLDPVSISTGNNHIKLEAGGSFILPADNKPKGDFRLGSTSGNLYIKAGKDILLQTKNGDCVRIAASLRRGSTFFEAGEDMQLLGNAQLSPYNGIYSFKSGRDLTFNSSDFRFIYKNRPLIFEAGKSLNFLRGINHSSSLTLKGNEINIGSPSQTHSVTITTNQKLLMDATKNLSLFGGKQGAAKLSFPTSGDDSIKIGGLTLKGGSGRSAYATFEVTKGSLLIDDNSIIDLGIKSKLSIAEDLKLVSKGDIVMKDGATLQAGKEIELSADGSISIGNNCQVISTNGSAITLIVDEGNPTIGKASFILEKGAQILSSPLKNTTLLETGKVRIFTAYRKNNRIDSTINGVPFTPNPDRENTTHEQWSTYYPSSYFGGPGFTLFYKELSNPPIPWTPLGPITKPPIPWTPITPATLTPSPWTPIDLKTNATFEMLWDLQTSASDLPLPAHFELIL